MPTGVNREMTDAIRNGKVVSVTYTLHDERGQLFEQSDIPVPYLHGHASGLFDKIEQQLEGKRTGDSIEATLSPEEGFGSHNPALTFTDDLENVPPELRYLGASLEAHVRGEAHRERQAHRGRQPPVGRADREIPRHHLRRA
jgi:FKBP-type peptidyl-prolyl cis-trans isomerase SlyD